MKIILKPSRRDDTLIVIKNGETLNINGEDFVLSPIGEGDTLPLSAFSSDWFAGPVERINGEIILNLILPNPWNYSQAQAFPIPLENIPDGLVEFPKPLGEEESLKILTSKLNEEVV